MFSFVIALLAAASGGEQTAVAVFKERFVPPRRVAVATVKELPDVAGVWIWSSDTPPQRTDASLRTKTTATASLTVRIETATPPPNDLMLVAAPVSMWEEVPEEVLPATKIEVGKDRKAVAKVVVNPKLPWRLRLKGSGAGSWWIDVPPGQRQATLTLIAAADRTVNVRDEGGGPIAQAAVQLLEEGRLKGGFRRVAEFRTDERGRLLIAGLPDSATPTILIGAKGHAPNVVTAKPSQFPSVVTMRPGHRVFGTVTNRSGAPIAGASVEMWVPIASTFPSPVLRQTKSDAEGRWEVGALPDGEGTWEIAAPPLATATGHMKLDKPVIDLGATVLEAGVKLDVQVNDDLGVPVEGAGIYTGDRTLGTTNAKGHATLTLAPKEALLIRAGKAHHHAAMRWIHATDRLVTLLLTRDFRIVGRFVDAAGVPVAGANITGYFENFTLFGEVQPDGRFDMGLEPYTKYDVELTSPRTGTVRFHVTGGPLGEVRDLGDIVAPAGVTVAGRLIRAGDASPVAGARVWALRPSTRGVQQAWGTRDMLETTSAADGTFTLTGLPQKLPFDLRIDAPPLAPLRKSFTPETNRIDAGDIALTAGATVVIRLRNDDGDDANGRVDTGGMFFSRDPLTAPFDNGVARIAGVPPGPALVSASQRGDVLCRQKATIPESSDDFEIDCDARRTTMSGVVNVGGSPAGHGTLTWRPFRQYALEAAMRDPFYSPEYPQQKAEVGSDGRFEGPRLIPGVWEVTWMPEAGRMYPPKTITVADAAVQEITLDYPGLSVDGIVLDANRRPVKAAMVNELDRHGFALSREDGTFTIGGPEPGRWRLQARWANQASDVKEVVVEDRPERPQVELVLGAEPNDVRVAAGRGAMVFLDSDAGAFQMASADDTGIATFHLQPPLPTRVRVASNTNGRWTLGEWIDRTEAVKTPIELKSGEAGNLVVHTKGAAGPVSITSMNGWRIDVLLQWAGASLRLLPGSDATVTGLPPGTYTIGVSTQQRTASVERDRSVELTFD